MYIIKCISKKFQAMNNEIKYSNINFGPFLFLSKVDDHLVKFLLDKGLETSQSHNKNLAGHLKKQYLYQKDIQEKFYSEFFPPFISAYRQAHCEYNRLPKNIPVELSYNDLWINFMKSGEFNPSHTHAGDISFVIFLSVPEQIHKEASKFEGIGPAPGSIIFHYGETTTPKWTNNQFSYRPRTGDLFIFPALLQHWVAPFQADATRISVSGNLTITNRQKFPKDYF